MAKKKTDVPAPASEPVRKRVVKRAPRAKAEPAAPSPAAAAGESVPKKAGRTTKPKAAGPEPSYEEIARVAYEIHLERGGEHGFHVEDWLEAETRLRSRR
jgi:hypothetical protein